MLQPKRSSEVADIRPYDYSGLNEAITTPAKQVSGFLENERLRNAAFIDSIQDDWKQMDPRDMEFLQPEMDALVEKHTESASKFNTSIAAPRNNEERQIRAELDKKALDIYRQGKFGATMNPIFDKTRAAVLQNPERYSKATVDFYGDEKNWYGKAPLDRSLPQAEEMSDLGGAITDILMGKFEESPWSSPMDPDTGIIKNYLTTRLYGNDKKRDELATEVAGDSALQPMFRQHFKDYLNRVNQLDLLENAVTPAGKAEYDDEFKKWKFMYAQQIVKDVNKEDTRLLGTQTIDLTAQREEAAKLARIASGVAGPGEDAPHNFYDSLFAIANGDPSKFTKQAVAGSDGSAQTIHKNENGIPYLISDAFKGMAMGEDATIEGFLLDQQTGDVFLLTGKGEGVMKVIEKNPNAIKDPYNQVGVQVQSQLKSASERDTWDKYVYDRFTMPDGSKNINIGRENIAKEIENRKSLVTAKGAQTFEKLQTFMDAVDSYDTGNNSIYKDKEITDGLVIDFVSSRDKGSKVYYGAKVKVNEDFWDFGNQFEFQIVDSQGKVIDGMDNLTKTELLSQLTNSIVALDEKEKKDDEDTPPASSGNTSTGIEFNVDPNLLEGGEGR